MVAIRPFFISSLMISTGETLSRSASSLTVRARGSSTALLSVTKFSSPHSQSFFADDVSFRFAAKAASPSRASAPLQLFLDLFFGGAAAAPAPGSKGTPGACLLFGLADGPAAASTAGRPPASGFSVRRRSQDFLGKADTGSGGPNRPLRSLGGS